MSLRDLPPYSFFEISLFNSLKRPKQVGIIISSMGIPTTKDAVCKATNPPPIIKQEAIIPSRVVQNILCGFGVSPSVDEVKQSTT